MFDHFLREFHEIRERLVDCVGHFSMCTHSAFDAMLLLAALSNSVLVYDSIDIISGVLISSEAAHYSFEIC